MTNQPQSPTSPPGKSIGQIAIRGALWITVLSALSLPLGLFRNWILNRFGGEEGAVVGTYALVFLFVNTINAFVIFGGPTAVAHYLPKIQNKSNKFRFIFTYWLISAATTAMFLVLIAVRPDILSWLMRRPAEGTTLLVLASLTPLVLFSQITAYSLSGLLAFRAAAVLLNAQMYIVVAVACGFYLFAPEFFLENALPLLVGAVALAHILVASVGFRMIVRNTTLAWKPMLPKGFWRYASTVHLLTIFSFAYMNIDQVFVVTQIGVKELGIYFALMQFAVLIHFVPQRIGQVMLASFSHLISQGRHEQLVSGYRKLCRVVIVLSVSMALVLCLYSRQIASIYGPAFAERHLYLLLLAAAFNMSNIGSINAMLILAKETTGVYMLNSIVLIVVQLVVTLSLVGSYEVNGVIAGKAASIVVAQIGLFLILRYRLKDMHLSVPKEYWLSQIAVLSTAVLAWHFDGQHPFLAAGWLVLVLGGFLAGIGSGPTEIRKIAAQVLNRKSSKKPPDDPATPTDG